MASSLASSLAGATSPDRRGASRRLSVGELSGGGGEEGCTESAKVDGVDLYRVLQSQQRALLASQTRVKELETQLRRSRMRETQLVLEATQQERSHFQNQNQNCKTGGDKENWTRGGNGLQLQADLLRWGEQELSLSQKGMQQAKSRAGSLQVEAHALRGRVRELEQRVQELEAENRVAVDYMLRQQLHSQRGPTDDWEVVEEHVQFLAQLFAARGLNFEVSRVRDNVYEFRGTELDLVVHQGRLLVRREEGVLEDFLELLAGKPSESSSSSKTSSSPVSAPSPSRTPMG